MIRDRYFEEIISVMIPDMFVYCLQLVQWNGVVVELTIADVRTIAVGRQRRAGLLKMSLNKRLQIEHVFWQRICLYVVC